MGVGDMRVFGMVVGNYVIHDIGVTVPHGREVTIPADKASKSKDLHKGLSQKSIFLLPSQPAPQHVAPVTHIRDDILQERNGFLEARCKQLEEENKRLLDENQRVQESLRLSASQGEQERMDTILKAIQGIKTGPVTYVNGAAPVSRADVADGTAPQFIPAEIAPKDAESRISTQRQTGDMGVSDAADKLRKMRRGAG